MKLAIAIHGHTREVIDKTYITLKEKILDKYDCDVFVSTYNRTGNRRFVTNVGEDTNNQKLVNPQDVIKIYDPKMIFCYDELSAEQIEHNERFKRFRNVGFKAECSFDMFCKTATLIREIRDFAYINNIEYDYILRIRPDIIIKEFNIENVQKESISFLDMGRQNEVCDIVWMGNPEQMSRMAHCWRHYEWLCETNQVKNWWYYSENMLYEFLKYYKIPFNIQKRDLPSSFIHFEVIRPYQGNFTW